MAQPACRLGTPFASNPLPFPLRHPAATVNHGRLPVPNRTCFSNEHPVAGPCLLLALQLPSAARKDGLRPGCACLRAGWDPVRSRFRSFLKESRPRLFPLPHPAIACLSRARASRPGSPSGLSGPSVLPIPLSFFERIPAPPFFCSSVLSLRHSVAASVNPGGLPYLRSPFSV